MKETNSRLIVFPYCLGCLSQSTTKSKSNKVATNMVLDEEKSSMVEIKKSWSYVGPSRSNISKAMERLLRVTLKSFANVFAYKDFEDIEIVTELEIGYPTDVKHVTHIGYDDGSTTTNPDKILDHLHPSTTLSLPSVSLKQFKLAMATQAEGRNL